MLNMGIAVQYSSFGRSRLVLLCFVFLASLSLIYYFDSGPIIAGRPRPRPALQGNLLKKGNPEPRQLQEFDPSNLKNYDQKDPNLVNYVRYHYIAEPSSLPYTFEGSPYTGIAGIVWPFLQKVVNSSKKGFFVEAGANDGLDGSNTIWLERTQGWNGLLVECHPLLFPIMRDRHRKAYISHACLSGSSHPTTAEMLIVAGWGGTGTLAEKIVPDFVGYLWPQLIVDAKSSNKTKKVKVQTIPLYTLLAAIKVDTVDFVSLDVQSLEYEILKDFPFDLILVKVWVIEVVLLLPETRIKLRNLMTKNGYLQKPGTGYDELYVHKSVVS